MLVDTGEIAQIENPSRQIMIGNLLIYESWGMMSVCWLADAMESGAVFEFDWDHTYGKQWRIAWTMYGTQKSIRLLYSKEGGWKDGGGFVSLSEAIKWLRDNKPIPTKNGVSVYKQLEEGMGALPYGNTQPMEKILTRC